MIDPTLAWLVRVLWGRDAQLRLGIADSSSTSAALTLPPRAPRLTLPGATPPAYFRRHDHPALAEAGPGRAPVGERVTVVNASRSALARLRVILGRADLGLAVRIDGTGGERMPIVRATDLSGRIVAEAKIGWNPSTNRLVRAEAMRLEAWLGRSPVRIGVPRVLALESWEDLELVVISPHPAEASAHRRVNLLPPAAATAEIAELDGRSEGPLLGSTYWRDVRWAVADLVARGLDPASSAGLGWALDTIERRHADTELAFGTWHGDWTPWNIAWSRGRLWVRSWGRSRPDVPVGLDLAAWRLRVALDLRHRSLAAAARRAADLPAGHLSALGVDPAATGALRDLSVLEHVVRAATGTLEEGVPGTLPLERVTEALAPFSA